MSEAQWRPLPNDRHLHKYVIVPYKHKYKL